MADCVGIHRFFVADTAVVLEEGTVSVIIVCTSCGLNQITTHKVAKPLSNIQLQKDKLK